jgi:O-antigen biosynthesis protein
VDNASSDDSVAMLQTKYPHVHVIANTTNMGFAKANNQALPFATGEYILYLNPDTIVAEDCFEKCMQYLQQHPNVGALGPRLIDGKGNFLPESKRGFPSFATAFFKISGLSSLFKKSAIFNQYHLGYLPENQTNEVDVLVGCFMMMPAHLVKQLGGFSEDYFMYGEDIDLSYCVQKAGFTNVYFPHTTVIHYKGESTKKGSLNYVKMFYNAMIIFAKKHLAPNRQQTFIPLIKLAIATRAFLSVINRMVNAIWLPIIDAVVMLFCLWQTKQLWMNYIKSKTKYDAQMIAWFFGTYVLIWLLSLWLSGVYDRPLKKANILKGMMLGGLTTLALYGLLPESIRFSRGITLLGAASSAMLIWLLRFCMQALGIEAVKAADNKGQSIITVGSQEQVNQVSSLLKTAGIDKDILGNVSATVTTQNPQDLGNVQYLASIAKTYHAAEIIFTHHANSFANIIGLIDELGADYNYKIHASGTDSIIGSNSKHTAGDLYAADWRFNIAKANGKRSKRMFDFVSALLLILLFPFLFWIIKPKQIFNAALHVLTGTKTWIGYCHVDSNIKLPAVKPAVFALDYLVQDASMNRQLLNLQYARNYNVSEDRKLFWQNLLQERK